MRVLIGGIGAAGAARDRVRDEQRACAERDPRATSFENLDLVPSLYDGVHFDRAAKLELGRRFAEAWFEFGGAPGFRATLATR